MDLPAGPSKIFLSLEKSLLEDYSVKEGLADEVRNLEQISRQITIILQAVHQKSDDSSVGSHWYFSKSSLTLLTLTQDNITVLEICNTARGHFKEVQEAYHKISQKVPEGDYYKYLSQWQNVSNKLCFLASLIIFLESGSLATREDVMEMLGVQIDRKKGFHIDLEDYLIGLLSLVNELSRLAVNSVICGDYKRPIRISKFVCELEAGFKLLNLKNDFLRKKYDGLKYDVKKIEQVVYDLKIRGLVANTKDA